MSRHDIKSGCRMVGLAVAPFAIDCGAFQEELKGDAKTKECTSKLAHSSYLAAMKKSYLTVSQWDELERVGLQLTPPASHRATSFGSMPLRMLITAMDILVSWLVSWLRMPQRRLGS